MCVAQNTRHVIAARKSSKSVQRAAQDYTAYLLHPSAERRFAIEIEGPSSATTA